MRLSRPELVDLVRREVGHRIGNTYLLHRQIGPEKVILVAETGPAQQRDPQNRPYADLRGKALAAAKNILLAKHPAKAKRVAKAAKKSKKIKPSSLDLFPSTGEEGERKS